MPEVPFGACRVHAVLVPLAAVTCAALGAQTPPPFAPPVAVTTLTLNGAAACVDVNRDGSRDVVLPALFFGTTITALDERGLGLATNVTGPALTPPPGVATIPVALAMAGGCLDGDTLEDVVTVTSCGSLHLHRNLGSTRLDRAHFAPDVLIDNFLAAYPISPPLQKYTFPAMHVVDFDGDGHRDLVLGGGPVDMWTGATLPGFVGFYRGDGAGNFQVARYPTTGNVLDVQVVDLDDDGDLDHLVALVETGIAGGFTHDLVHLVWSGGALVATTIASGLCPGRTTAFALADVVGDANPDYLLAQAFTNAGVTGSAVYCFPGDGQGTPQTSAWSTMALPANATTLGDYIAAIVAGDWNRDGEPDLAVLRGYVLPAPAFSTSPGTYADSELLIALGPAAASATCSTIVLPGTHYYASTGSHLFAQLPLVAAPGLLRTIDLGGNGSPDLLVTGVRTASTTAPLAIVTLVNTTPAAPGDARFEPIGAPSGGAPGWPARLGFEGGRPRPGNRTFACTLLNVRGNSLAALMWGPVGMANMFSTHGFDVHLAPTLFGFTTITSGTLPGDGFASYPLPIPQTPALVGDAGWFQWFHFDGALGVFGASHATGLSIGS